jgi:hypothetical protein
MKKPANRGLTKLADAAFEQAARKVLERAEKSGTPVIICVNQEMKAVEPRAVRNELERANGGARSGPQLEVDP